MFRWGVAVLRNTSWFDGIRRQGPGPPPALRGVQHSVHAWWRHAGSRTPGRQLLAAHLWLDGWEQLLRGGARAGVCCRAAQPRPSPAGRGEEGWGGREPAGAPRGDQSGIIYSAAQQLHAGPQGPQTAAAMDSHDAGAGAGGREGRKAASAGWSGRLEHRRCWPASSLRQKQQKQQRRQRHC